MTAILKRLTIGGRMIIVIYYGHEGGEAEKTKSCIIAEHYRRKNSAY